MPRRRQRSKRARGFKPLNALATVGAAAHNGFERWAGVGVFLEPWIGRRATNVLWSAALPLGVVRALHGGERDGPPLAFNAGIAVAGALVHYVNWPCSRRWGLVPWLDEAEGLTPAQMPFYNAILLAWLAAGAGSIAFETRGEHVKYALAGVATGPLLLASARHHFAWATRQARRDPERWSRSLLDGDDAAPAG